MLNTVSTIKNSLADWLYDIGREDNDGHSLRPYGQTVQYH